MKTESMFRGMAMANEMQKAKVQAPAKKPATDFESIMSEQANKSQKAI